MGVLQCDRRECENIMCDRYSPKYGYICYECFDELVSLGADANIGHFMVSAFNNSDITVDAYELFNKEFDMRD